MSNDIKEYKDMGKSNFKYCPFKTVSDLNKEKDWAM